MNSVSGHNNAGNNRSINSSGENQPVIHSAQQKTAQAATSAMSSTGTSSPRSAEPRAESKQELPPVALKKLDGSDCQKAIDNFERALKKLTDHQKEILRDGGWWLNCACAVNKDLSKASDAMDALIKQEGDPNLYLPSKAKPVQQHASGASSGYWGNQNPNSN